MDILHVTAAFDNLELGEEESMWNSLPNELLINILRYLPHRDLQQIRLVCKRWHHITQLPEFMEKSKLIINPDNVVSLYTYLTADVELSSILEYNTLELHDLDVSDDLESILKSLGQNIREVRLHTSPVFKILNDCVPKLEALYVRETIFKFSNVSSKLENLKSLDISGCTGIKYFIPNLRSNLLCSKMEKCCLELDLEENDCMMYTLQNYAIYLKHLEIKVGLSSAVTTEWKKVFASFRQLETLKIIGYKDHVMKEIMECFPQEMPLRNCVLRGDVNGSLLQLILHKWSASMENMELMLSSDPITDQIGVYCGNI